MLKVAITGNIASGKTQVQYLIESYGYKVLDTDITAHKILDDNKEVLEAFKNYDILENGKISREKLGKIVFTDKKLLERLNSIMHPLVRLKIKEFFNENINEKMVFVTIPLLFETGMEGMFDKIVLVSAHEDVRLERLMKRNGYTKEYAMQRIKAQMAESEKIERVDEVVRNDDIFEYLMDEVSTLVQKLEHQSEYCE